MALTLRLVKGSPLAYQEGDDNLSGLANGSNWTAIGGAQSFTGAITMSSSLTLSTLTSGRIPFASTGGLLADSANLQWSAANNQLLLGAGLVTAPTLAFKDAPTVGWFRDTSYESGGWAFAGSTQEGVNGINSIMIRPNNTITDGSKFASPPLFFVTRYDSEAGAGITASERRGHLSYIIAGSGPTGYFRFRSDETRDFVRLYDAVNQCIELTLAANGTWIGMKQGTTGEEGNLFSFNSRDFSGDDNRLLTIEDGAGANAIVSFDRAAFTANFRGPIALSANPLSVADVFLSRGAANDLRSDSHFSPTTAQTNLRDLGISGTNLWRTGYFGTSVVAPFARVDNSAVGAAVADSVQVYSSDDAAGHTIPSFYCEGTNVLATGQADSVSSVRVKIRVNGTIVTLLGI